MSYSIEDAKKLIDSQIRSDRRRKLFEIINMIFNNQIDSSKKPMSDIFNQLGPRQRYVSPKERSTHNYGYMEMDEMLAGTPFYGEL